MRIEQKRKAVETDILSCEDTMLSSLIWQGRTEKKKKMSRERNQRDHRSPLSSLLESLQCRLGAGFTVVATLRALSRWRCGNPARVVDRIG
jgi:hypothetical protein